MAPTLEDHLSQEIQALDDIVASLHDILDKHEGNNWARLYILLTAAKLLLPDTERLQAFSTKYAEDATPFSIVRVVMHAALESDCIPVMEQLLSEGQMSLTEELDELDHGLQLPYAPLKHAQSAIALQTMLEFIHIPSVEDAVALDSMIDTIETCVDIYSNDEFAVLLDFIVRHPVISDRMHKFVWWNALTAYDEPNRLTRVKKAGVPLPNPDESLARELTPEAVVELPNLGLLSLLKGINAGEMLRRSRKRISPACARVAMSALQTLLQCGDTLESVAHKEWLWLLRGCTAKTRLPATLLHAVPLATWVAHMQQKGRGTKRMHITSQRVVGKLAMATSTHNDDIHVRICVHRYEQFILQCLLGMAQAGRDAHVQT